MLALLASAAACHSTADAPHAPALAATGPRRLALLAGGAGESGENFFAEDLKDFGAALGARGWQVSSLVGADALNAKLLAGVTGELRSARAGDEVLLVFHSHGRERETQWGQRSHSIVSQDRDRSGSDPDFDLDAIEPGLREAKARGVHVALVDLSCYSGTTQILRGPDCTLTLAAPDYISLCSGRPEERHFSSRFFKLPPPGAPVDLESQFLAARAADLDSVNLPQISSLPTPALEGWNSFLYVVDPLDVFEDLKQLRTGTKPFDPKKLLGPIDQVVRTKPSLKPLREEIARKLKRAVLIRSGLEHAIPALSRDYGHKVELALDGRGKLRLSLGDLGDLLAKLGEPGFKVADFDGASQAERDLMRALRPERARLMQSLGSELSGFESRRSAFDRLSGDLESAADELMNSEREFYARAAKSTAGSAGCRGFAL